MCSEACQNNGYFPAFWQCMLRDRGISFRAYLPPTHPHQGGRWGWMMGDLGTRFIDSLAPYVLSWSPLPQRGAPLPLSQTISAISEPCCALPQG